MKKLIFILLGGVFIGCTCGTSKKITLSIISPQDGTVLEPKDDVDDTLEGIQYDVTAEVYGLEIGEEITLTTNQISPAVIKFSGENIVVFKRYSFKEGENKLQLSVKQGKITSKEITVVVKKFPALIISFVRPKDRDVLTQKDDKNQDLEDGFQYDIELKTNAEDNSTVTLEIGPSLQELGPAEEKPVKQGKVIFENITLSSGKNYLKGTVTTKDGRSHSTLISIEINIALPTCNIIEPQDAVLTSNHDINPEKQGLQIQVKVSTNAEQGVVTLLIDEKESLQQKVSQESAIFSEVNLQEGQRTLQAKCKDKYGNTGVSTKKKYLVDTLPPTIEITYPKDGATFNKDADCATAEDESAREECGFKNWTEIEDVQIMVCFNSDETDQKGCAAPLGTDPLPEIGCADITEEGACVLITCPQGRTQIEAYTYDEYQNKGQDIITITCDFGLPEVHIANVKSGDQLNIEKDKNPTLKGFQFDLEACVNEANGEATLFAGDTQIAKTEVVSDEDGCDWPGKDPDSPRLPAHVIFEGITIPETRTLEKQNGNFIPKDPILKVQVKDEAENIGESLPVTPWVDSIAPRLMIVEPICGQKIYLDKEKEPLINVKVWIDEKDRKFILSSYRGEETIDAKEGMALFGNYATIEDLEVAEGGISLTATATDDIGNRGESPSCTIFVFHKDLWIYIQEPKNRTILSQKDDCNPTSPEFDIKVSVVSNVDPGNEVSLNIGGVPKATQDYQSGGISFCVSQSEARDVEIEVSTIQNMKIAKDSIHVSIDVTPPEPIANLTSQIINPREVRIKLSWTAPWDQVGGQRYNVSGYEIRYSSSPITEENFNQAIPSSFLGAPSAPGETETHEISGLRLEKKYYFAVRSIDIASQYSNVVSTSEPIISKFNSILIDGPTQEIGFALDFDDAGDINADKLDDIIVGSNKDEVYLFFGREDRDFSRPDVTIYGEKGTGFGIAVAGIGDFNNDRIDDIAIGAPYLDAFKGKVYLFWGRTEWPLVLQDKDADLKIIHNDPDKDISSKFGYRVKPCGDFDGDGISDLLISAPYYPEGREQGIVYLVLGRQNPPETLILPWDKDLVFEGEAEGGLFGAWLAPIGSVSGPLDTLDDIIISAHRIKKVYLFEGRPSQGFPPNRVLTSLNATRIFESADKGFGSSVAGIGDLDGNRYRDIAIGAPTFQNSQGRIYIYLNSPDFFGEAPVIIENANTAPKSDFLGYNIANTTGISTKLDKSVDADGIPDLIYLSLWCKTSVFGCIYLGFGGGDVSEWGSSNDADIFIDLAPDGILGLKLRALGDITGDGFIDIGVSNSFYNTSQGRLKILF